MRSRSLLISIALSAKATGARANNSPANISASERTRNTTRARAHGLFPVLERVGIKPSPVSCPRIVLQQGKKIMILPNAVDLQIAARPAFALEAGLLEHRRGSEVVRQAGGLQPMQAERHE